MSIFLHRFPLKLFVLRGVDIFLVRTVSVKNVSVFVCFILGFIEPSWRSQDSDWLRVVRQSVRSSSPSKCEIFHFSMSFIPFLRVTKLPIQWVQRIRRPSIKLITCLEIVPSPRKHDLHIHFSMQLVEVELNFFSIGPT